MNGAAQVINLAGFLIYLINAVVVPLIFAIAFLTFIWGVYQYLIAGAADAEKRDKGRNFIIYGIIGFFIMVSVWGLVNVVVRTFGFGAESRPPLPTFGGQQGSFGSRPGTVNGSGEFSPTGPCGEGMIRDFCGFGHDCIPATGQCYSNTVGSGGEPCVQGQCTQGHACNQTTKMCED